MLLFDIVSTIHSHCHTVHALVPSYVWWCSHVCQGVYAEEDFIFYITFFSIFEGGELCSTAEGGDVGDVRYYHLLYNIFSFLEGGELCSTAEGGDVRYYLIIFMRDGSHTFTEGGNVGIVRHSGLWSIFCGLFPLLFLLFFLYPYPFILTLD